MGDAGASGKHRPFEGRDHRQAQGLEKSIIRGTEVKLLFRSNEEGEMPDPAYRWLFRERRASEASKDGTRFLCNLGQPSNSRCIGHRAKPLKSVEQTAA